MLVHIDIQVETVFKSVMTSFKSHIAAASWMDEATRDTALDKADAIERKIGYPDLVTSPTFLDQYYEQV